MHRLVSVFAASLLVLIGVTSAPAQHMNEKGSPCAGIATTARLVECLSNARKSAESELNSTYKQVESKLTAADAERLKKIEQLWIQYRDATCAAERDIYDGGTGGSPAYLACMEAMTRGRTKELQITYAVKLKK